MRFLTKSTPKQTRRIFIIFQSLSAEQLGSMSQDQLTTLSDDQKSKLDAIKLAAVNTASNPGTTVKPAGGNSSAIKSISSEYQDGSNGRFRSWLLWFRFSPPITKPVSLTRIWITFNGKLKRFQTSIFPSIMAVIVKPNVVRRFTTISRFYSSRFCPDYHSFHHLHERVVEDSIVNGTGFPSVPFTSGPERLQPVIITRRSGITHPSPYSISKIIDNALWVISMDQRWFQAKVLQNMHREAIVVMAKF